MIVSMFLSMSKTPMLMLLMLRRKCEERHFKMLELYFYSPRNLVFHQTFDNTQTSSSMEIRNVGTHSVFLSFREYNSLFWVLLYL